jgi:hypothetical protein
VKNLSIAVVALLVVFGALFWRKVQRISSENLSGEVKDDKNSIHILDPRDVVKAPNILERRTQNQLEKIKWDRSQRKIGLSTYPIPIVNHEAILEFEIATTGACFPGDANAIAMELKSSPSHKVLVTLESLSGDGKSFSWDLPRSFFSTGKAGHEFRLPVSPDPVQYAFYLCTAESSDTSCRSKTVKDINEIFTEHIQKNPQAGKELRNIFFQYFILDERGLTAFADTPKGAQRFEDLKKYLQERRSSEKKMDEVIGLTKKNTQTLASLPFQFDGKKLKVELPEYRPEACAKSQKTQGRPRQ